MTGDKMIIAGSGQFSLKLFWIGLYLRMLRRRAIEAIMLKILSSLVEKGL
jgi:hypothetical protein